MALSRKSTARRKSIATALLTTSYSLPTASVNWTINHLWTRARQRDIKTAGFGLREIVMFDTPANFPPMGFQVGAIYLSRGWSGSVKLTDWNAPVGTVDGDAPSARGNRLAADRADEKSDATLYLAT